MGNPVFKPLLGVFHGCLFLSALFVAMHVLHPVLFPIFEMIISSFVCQPNYLMKLLLRTFGPSHPLVSLNCQLFYFGICGLKSFMGYLKLLPQIFHLPFGVLNSVIHFIIFVELTGHVMVCFGLDIRRVAVGMLWASSVDDLCLRRHRIKGVASKSSCCWR